MAAPPIPIKKGEPAPNDGLWVDPEFYNILVSGCEKCLADKNACLLAFDKCNKISDEILETRDAPSVKYVWGGGGILIGILFTVGTVSLIILGAK